MSHDRDWQIRFNFPGNDQARGKFSLDGDDLTLDFENGSLSNDPVFQKIDGLAAAMAQAMGGNYIRFPFWARNASGFLNNDFSVERKMICVHPLGGCIMGNIAADGVMDTKGHVFNAAPGAPSPVYDGLYVMEASIIPGPLAANPTLTNVALVLKEVNAMNRGQLMSVHAGRNSACSMMCCVWFPNE